MILKRFELSRKYLPSIGPIVKDNIPLATIDKPVAAGRSLKSTYLGMITDWNTALDPLKSPMIKEEKNTIGAISKQIARRVLPMEEPIKEQAKRIFEDQPILWAKSGITSLPITSAPAWIERAKATCAKEKLECLKRMNGIMKIMFDSEA